MSLAEIIAALIFVAACAAAATPGIVIRPGIWYRDLAKPAWRPPNWIFGPVWLVLYISVALSGWLVWREAGLDGAAWPLGVYAVHLVFNGLWSVFFFGLRRPDLALIEICFFWLSIIATMAAFHTVNATAAWILIPYLCWVTFAVMLNLRIWRLNPVTPSR